MAMQTERENAREAKSEESSNSSVSHDCYFKEGRYRLFTDVYGVYEGHSFKHEQKGRMVLRHNTLEAANEAARALMSEYGIYCNSVNGVVHGEIVTEEEFSVIPSITKICVEELPPHKLKETELQELVIKYDIEAGTGDTTSSQICSKTELIDVIYPTLQHKIHQNRRSEKELLGCSLCQKLYKDEYELLIETDPEIKRQRMQFKMKRKHFRDPITLKQIQKKYGAKWFDHWCLSDGVTKQKLHWGRKVCFGNEYNIYESDEIQRYYEEMLAKRKDEESNNKDTAIKQKPKSAKSGKRKKRAADDEVAYPPAKKSRIDSYFKRK